MKNQLCKKENIIIALLGILTVAASVIKIRMEIDIDEMYVVTMGMRMLQGDRMFADMWDLHMTSAWASYIGLLILRTLTGGLDGAVLFLRSSSVFAQLGAALFSYRILRKYNNRMTSALAAFVIANFLPRATQNFEYGLMEMIFIVVAVMMLYDVVKSASSKIGRYHVIRIIIAGVFYSLGVLSYPTVILSFPIILYGIGGVQVFLIEILEQN